MKSSLVFVLALLFTSPANADSGDVPANFDEAIQWESAADQGFKAPIPKSRPVKKEVKTPLKAKPKAKQKGDEVKDAIADFIKFNELHGEDQAESEDECAETATSQAEFNACLEALGLNRAVVSSRHVAGKKTPGRQGNEEHEKSSVDFVQ